MHANKLAFLLAVFCFAVTHTWIWTNPILCPSVFVIKCSAWCAFTLFYVIWRGSWVILEALLACVIYFLCPLANRALEIDFADDPLVVPHALFTCVCLCCQRVVLHSKQRKLHIPSPHPSSMTQWPFHSSTLLPCPLLAHSHAALNHLIITGLCE